MNLESILYIGGMIIYDFNVSVISIAWLYISGDLKKEDKFNRVMIMSCVVTAAIATGIFWPIFLTIIIMLGSLYLIDSYIMKKYGEEN